MQKIQIKDQNSVTISEDMYGLFFEDINYGLDGGLSAEMLENRNFESVMAYGPKYTYEVTFDGLYGWSLYGTAPSDAVFRCDCEEPLNQINPHYLYVESPGDEVSFMNKAYDGLMVRKSLEYQVSFYAKAMSGKGDISISIRKNGITYAQALFVIDDTAKGEWKQYHAALHSGQDVSGADFVVTVKGKAAFAFDWFSMMPADAVCGIFRKDLAELLKGLNPSFLRFPGGCVIEGNTLENRYQWKKSVGPVEERKTNWNRWAVHSVDEMPDCTGPYAHYGQTLTVGYYEYFLLCEYLNAKPLPVLSVGLACQFMSKEMVGADSREMEEFIQDALDLIEFALGDENTTWGKVRADMGHPRPFALEYLGIGNEQWETEDSHFFRRYEMFEKRIHEKYPEIKLIGSAGPDVSSEKYDKAWKFYGEKKKENPDFYFAVDEHYYVTPEWLYANTHFYDGYDRSAKVFAGEYACHIPGKAGKMNCPEANTLGAALAEAAFLTGVERNGDVVRMASYAPLFARLGYTQWSPDLIWFDGERAYGTPSYYVQQMFSRNRGLRTLSVNGSAAQEKEGIYASAVLDGQGDVLLKIVNASEKPEEIEILAEECPGAAGYSVVEMAVLTGDPEGCNSIRTPDKIKPESRKAKGTVVLDAYSFSVIRLSAV